jgi:two-component system chemotaxis sensor kinase CheA
MSSQQDFLRELLADFKIEASEHYKAIVNGLLEIEKGTENPALKDIIEKTFREVHSLKGAARAVNLGEIERLCQSLENVFHALKLGKIDIQSIAYDIMFKVLDTLNVLLQEIDQKEKSISAQTISSLMKKLELIQQGKLIQPVSQPVVSESKELNPVSDKNTGKTEIIEAAPFSKPITAPVEVGGSKDTVRISVSKLEKLLLEAEEFITLKSALKYQIEKLSELPVTGLRSHTRDLERYHRQMSRMVDDLLLDIKTTLLLPFSSLLEIVPRIIRDLSKEFGKQVNLIIHGAENEIDRRILEELKDPVIHLVRNCIDHGIEIMQVREKSGKPGHGTIRIKVTQESGSRINLIIEDDGAGLNKTAILQAAIKSGTISAEGSDKLPDQDVFSLIFKSGISTSPFITDISGRGLGMAIVAEKVTNLGGTIQVDSIQGKGTTFNISLPVTLSTFKGILVRLNRQRFIVPVSAVESAFRVWKHALMTVEGQGFIHYQGENVGIYRLNDLIGMEDNRQKQTELPFYQTLIVSWAQRRVGFIVDEIFGEQEGTVKSLGNQLAHIKHISGAIILGNGSVVPILNVHEIMDTVIKSRQKSFSVTIDGGEERVTEEGRKILIAEDSITLRSLLRNIIESSGYQVKTAVDGLEAFQFLTMENFDLLVSDVEMPRLNGFGLTERVRGDKRLAELPVILVTALDTHEDRQRGMEAGANAYIVKGSFEQSNLLETIKRLL